MSDCNRCVMFARGCYCPPDKHCIGFVKKKDERHMFEFITDEDWKPMTPACWVDCPFSFMIGLGNRCKCLDKKYNIKCPFVGNYY